jgi:hypothetical protein
MPYAELVAPTSCATISAFAKIKHDPDRLKPAPRPLRHRLLDALTMIIEFTWLLELDYSLIMSEG